MHVLKDIFLTKSSILLGTLLQGIGMLAGYGLIAFLAFTGSLSSLTFALVLIYQLIWTLLTILLPGLRSY